jgi:DNA-binding protein HU-beta
MSNITTDDIIRYVAGQHSLTMADSKRVVSSVFQFITDSVGKKKKVSVNKFGAFVPTKTKAYTGRNPQTGKPLRIPAKTRVRFRAFDSFKSSVSGC